MHHSFWLIVSHMLENGGYRTLQISTDLHGVCPFYKNVTKRSMHDFLMKFAHFCLTLVGFSQNVNISCYGQLNTSSDQGGPMGPYHSFSHILLLWHQIFWPVLFVIVTLMDTLLLTQKNPSNLPIVFSLISINYHFWGAGKSVLPLKSYRNKMFGFLFQ